MTYTLGVDLGTTYTAAALADASGARMVDLAHDRVAIRSLVAPPVDGDRAVVGEEALAIAATNPERVAREFKRRFGDPTPMLVNGEPWSPERLSALLLAEVVERVAAMEGERPSELVITHPATWREHRLELLTDVAAGADVATVSFLTEPVAAAIHYHERSRVPEAARIAVYDLGGGTFDAAILERLADTYRIVGEPQGLDWVGGLDFDEAVFELIAEAVGGALSGLDPTDGATLRAVARLKEECTQAKVGLSFESSVGVPVVLPHEAEQVVVHRAEFESRIEHLVEQTIDALAHALGTADIAVDDLHAVLLVGGSSRVPLVAERLTARLGVEVVVDTHPKHAVAMGAALSTGSLSDVAEDAPERLDTVEPQVIPELTVDVSQLREEVTSRYLLPLTGPLAGLPLTVESDPLTIGRIDDGEVVGLPDPMLSRRHLSVSRSGSVVTVTDLDSTNGTWVDGERLTESLDLDAGAVIEVGTTLLLVDGPLASLPAPDAVARSWRMPSLQTGGGLRSVFGGRRASREWSEDLRDRLDELVGVSGAVRRARRLQRSSGPRAVAWRTQAPARIMGRPADSDDYGTVTIGYGPRPGIIDLTAPDGLRGRMLDELDDSLRRFRTDPWSPIEISLLGQVTAVAADSPQATELLRSMLYEFVGHHPDEPLVVLGIDPEVTGWGFLRADSVTIATDDGRTDRPDALVVSYGPGRVASSSVSDRGSETGERGTLRVVGATEAHDDADLVIGASGTEGVCCLTRAGTDLMFIPATLPAEEWVDAPEPPSEPPDE